ncbi:hypothetical protein DFJ63DRAFT_332583 [Scheffersomyces coipomensis]|uniref:uncharacterized protein n=1 Tax=Scheffersomyces coipomensis TaxID=1788519 RepID=UPI00315C5D06
MDSNDHLFGDIEQDNNPSFYGNPSMIHDPYGNQRDDTIDDHPDSANTFVNIPPPPSNGGHSSTTPSEFSDSIISNPPPYQPSKHPQFIPQPNDLVNNTIDLSNKIKSLLNDPHVEIHILSSERLVNSSVIVYTVQLLLPKTKDSIIVKRRYSEFKSLRDNLNKLFPTIIIPPIPEKHSLLSYLINSINNSHEIDIIEMRKRYFKTFLTEVVFNSSEKLRNCLLLHKFFDPNYELGWYNALNEPPVSLIPNNLLLANPLNTIDQNGLYSLLPLVNGFEFDSSIDNLSSLKKINDDWKKLNDQIKLFEYKTKTPPSPTESKSFIEIPQNLIQFEIKVHNIIKILQDLNKINARSVKNYKIIINNLIELGGNLNNFSLQIFESSSHISSITTSNDNNNLSLAIEKFGSTIDSNFLSIENFIMNQLIPEWQEPIHQLTQHYIASLNLIKFYKYKIIQFKILYKLKFNKFQEILNLTNMPSISTDTTTNLNINENGPVMTDANGNLDHLKDLQSPSLSNALQRLEVRKKRGKLSNKKSWYGLFGGNKPYNFSLPPESATTTSSSQSSPPRGNNNSADRSNAETINNQYKLKLNQIEKELDKLNQLVILCDQDMVNLTTELTTTFTLFLKDLEARWLKLMINYIKNGKSLFQDNLANWQEFKQFLVNN